jgi:hypothetical protein
MSTPTDPISVGGISVANSPAIFSGGAHGAGGGVGGGVLAFTGTGPGTLPLVLVGFAAIVAGTLATWFGHERNRSGAPDNGLVDLSGLVD